MLVSGPDGSALQAHGHPSPLPLDFGPLLSLSQSSWETPWLPLTLPQSKGAGCRAVLPFGVPQPLLKPETELSEGRLTSQ